MVGYIITITIVLQPAIIYYSMGKAAKEGLGYWLNYGKGERRQGCISIIT